MNDDDNKNKNENNKLTNIKTTLVLLGASCVGKTSILGRITQKGFNDFSESTIGAAFGTYHKQYKDRLVHFDIWDTAGQERYRSLTPLYYRHATSILLVYDITNRSSFERISSYIEDIKAIKGKLPLCVLVGNKSDMKFDRKIDILEGKRLAADVGIHFIESSAKTNTNIEKMFEIVGTNITNCDTLINDSYRVYLEEDDTDDKHTRLFSKCC